MTELLKIDHLNIEFHDHLLPETVVTDFSMTISEGEIVGLVGESGSGKSMTAMAVCGLLSRHDMKKDGEIFFRGEELLTCSREKLRKIQGNQIGIIFQEPMTSLNPVKRIGWQVEEALRIHTTYSKEERRNKAIKMLQRTGLQNAEQIYSMYPHQLSGGMRQRVMIAAAMIQNPSLLIADEPTTALDVTVQKQIIELLQTINQESHTAILFISHDLSLVRRLCGRVIVMKDGHMVESGKTEEIFANPKNPYTKKLIDAIPGFEKRK